MPHTLRADLVIEHVDNDVLILDGQSSTVHRFTGSHAEAIKRLDAGENIEAFSTELADLDAAGLLETESEGSAVSRRGVLLGGSALAGSAALAMSMPGLANAQSVNTLPVEGISIINTLSGVPVKATFSVELPSDGAFVAGQTWTLVVLRGFRSPDEFEFDPPRTADAVVVDDSDLGLTLTFADVDVANDGGFQTNLFFEVRLERGGISTGVIETEFAGS